MGKKRAGSKEHAHSAVPHHYEGEAVLGELLAVAGSELEVAEVKEQLRQAQAQKVPAAQAFPSLFAGEPHFPAPDLAMRLYANLFGLWDRLAAGGPVEPTQHAGPSRHAEEKREVAPKPAAIAEGPVTEEFVEGAWRYLADLPQREMERLMHRYENTQPELSEWVRQEAGTPDVALENADTLSFELWAILELAFSEKKFRPVLMSELESSRPSPEKLEPALESYLTEALEEAKLDEKEPLLAGDSERIAPIVRAVVRTLLAQR